MILIPVSYKYLDLMCHSSQHTIVVPLGIPIGLLCNLGWQDLDLVACFVVRDVHATVFLGARTLNT